jgi:hypothetical protein
MLKARAQGSAFATVVLVIDDLHIGRGVFAPIVENVARAIG